MSALQLQLQKSSFQFLEELRSKTAVTNKKIHGITTPRIINTLKNKLNECFRRSFSFKNIHKKVQSADQIKRSAFVMKEPCLTAGRV